MGFCVCLASLHKILSRFSHNVHESTAHSIPLLNNIPFIGGLQCVALLTCWKTSELFPVWGSYRQNCWEYAYRSFRGHVFSFFSGILKVSCFYLFLNLFRCNLSTYKKWQELQGLFSQAITSFTQIVYILSHLLYHFPSIYISLLSWVIWEPVVDIIVWSLSRDLLDCSPPGPSVHGIIQARILEWVAISSSRGSSWPRDGTHVSCVFCIGRRILNHHFTRETQL